MISSPRPDDWPPTAQTPTPAPTPTPEWSTLPEAVSLSDAPQVVSLSEAPQIVSLSEAPQVVCLSEAPEAARFLPSDAPENVRFRWSQAPESVPLPGTDDPVCPSPNGEDSTTEVPAIVTQKPKSWLRQRRNQAAVAVVAVVIFAILATAAVVVLVVLIGAKDEGNPNSPINITGILTDPQDPPTPSSTQSAGLGILVSRPFASEGSALASACNNTVCPQMLSATTLTISSTTTTFLFARGIDSAIWYREITYSAFVEPRPSSFATANTTNATPTATSTTHGWKSGWQSLGGTFLSQPASSSMRPGRIDVFGIWTDSTTRVKTFKDGVWDVEWTSLGGVCGSPPVTCSYGTDNNNVVIVGSDHAVYHKYLNNGNNWGPSLGGEWEEQNGWVSSSADVGCAISAGGVVRFEIVAYGKGATPETAETHGMFFMRFNSSHKWDSDWSGGLGSFRGDPTIVASSDRTDYFGIGTDSAVYTASWTQPDGMSTLMSLGGDSQSAVAAYATGLRLDVLVVGNDTRLKHLARIDGSWGRAWEDLGGYFNSAPKPVVLNDTAVAVFGMGPDGSVIHGVFSTDAAAWEWGQGLWYSDEGHMSPGWFRQGPA